MPCSVPVARVVMAGQWVSTAPARGALRPAGRLPVAVSPGLRAHVVSRLSRCQQPSPWPVPAALQPAPGTAVSPVPPGLGCPEALLRGARGRAAVACLSWCHRGCGGTPVAVSAGLRARGDTPGAVSLGLWARAVAHPSRCHWGCGHTWCHACHSVSGAVGTRSGMPVAVSLRLWAHMVSCLSQCHWGCGLGWCHACRSVTRAAGAQCHACHGVTGAVGTCGVMPVAV